jgi:DNA polymerase-3 subunit epsilon
VSNSLDALCQRYGIDNSRRTKHGALLDAEILSEVYAELLGGRQAALVFKSSPQENAQKAESLQRQRPAPLVFNLSEAERQAHRDFIEKLHPNPIWSRYLMPSQDTEAIEGMIERQAAG